MKCECGSRYHVSKHVPMPTGWITLSTPMCESCRKKVAENMQSSYSALMNKAEEIAKNM